MSKRKFSTDVKYFTKAGAVLSLSRLCDDVTKIWDAIEDSDWAGGIIMRLNRVCPHAEFFINRETSQYVRLSVIEQTGYCIIENYLQIPILSKE